jgi:SAM-dependent methyltransferase
MTDLAYVGSELDLFAEVHNWKAYWSRHVQPYVLGDVLEVGAGIGSNTPLLDAGTASRWVCLEPDSRLVARMVTKLSASPALRSYECVCGTLQSLDSSQTFDTIVYIDVLEHIEDDRGEMEAASRHLRPGGRIIVLSPAHQWLFTPFDKAIGHFRRYNKAMLRAVSPPGLRRERLFYLDSLGLFLSLANRMLLRQSMPTKSQLQVWDKGVIPFSRVLDRCIFHLAGKTIIGVWQRNVE